MRLKVWRGDRETLGMAGMFPSPSLRWGPWEGGRPLLLAIHTKNNRSTVRPFLPSLLQGGRERHARVPRNASTHFWTILCPPTHSTPSSLSSLPFPSPSSHSCPPLCAVFVVAVVVQRRAHPPSNIMRKCTYAREGPLLRLSLTAGPISNFPNFSLRVLYWCNRPR